MPEHLLDAAQIGTPVEQIGGEGVAHVVRGEGGIDPRLRQRALEHPADRVGRIATAPIGDEEEGLLREAQKLRTRVQRVGAQRRDGHVVQRDDPLLRPLSEHLHLALLEIDVCDEQRGGLGDTRPARVEELEQRLVAHIGRRPFAVGVPLAGRRVDGEDARHIGGADDARELAAEARALQRAHGIGRREAGGHQPAEERAQRGEPPVDRGAAVLGAVELAEVAAQVAMGRGDRIDPAARRPAEVVGHVDPVGARRVLRQAALGPQRRAETLGERLRIRGGGVAGALIVQPAHRPPSRSGRASPASARSSR